MGRVKDMPYGIVKEIKGNTAVVTMERQDMCGDCHACEMISGKKSCTLTCKTYVPCQVGDQVEVTLTNDYFLKATYLIYGVPLVGFLVGMIAGIALSKVIQSTHEDIIVALGMIIGTAIGVLYIKRKDKQKAYQQFLPHIVGKKEEV